MPDFRNPFMAPEDQAQPTAPRGGLADRTLGGLEKFMGNVAKGLDVVMSNPLYARAWSGAVSGQAQDPMAGPVALEALRRAQQPSLQDELNHYRIRQMQRSEAEAEREAARRERLANTDPRNFNDVYRQEFPEEAAAASYKQSLKPPPAPKAPSLKAVMTPNGPRYVDAKDAINMPPVPRSPLVQIGGDGLNPYQTAQTRKSYIDAHRDDSKPYVDALGRLRELEGLLADLDGEPTPFQSEAAATAFAKGLKPAEAVMRDDIARILGQGFANQLKGFLNLPQKASRAQIQQMRDALAQVVSVAEMRQRGIDEKYRALGSDYQVEIPSYAPSSSPSAGTVTPPSAMPAQGASMPPADAPEGSTPHPTVPGLWIAPDGTGYVN